MVYNVLAGATVSQTVRTLLFGGYPGMGWVRGQGGEGGAFIFLFSGLPLLLTFVAPGVTILRMSTLVDLASPKYFYL